MYSIQPGPHSVAAGRFLPAGVTLDTYTHVTGDMQKRASEVVGDFLTELLGEELKPWQSAENGAAGV